MSDKIYLSKEEQLFLIKYLEINDPVKAAEKFAFLMVEEGADPTQIQKYLSKILKRLQ